jgi:glycosyltransferase involved in cell wall biosynthesis
MKIKGLPYPNVELGGMPGLNLKFYDEAVGYDQAIYFAPFLAFPRVKPRSVVVSHGVAWDYPGHPWNSTSGPLHQDWLRRLFYSVAAPDLFVSVDTNTLNWIRSTWPGYEHKQAYIPNFVDTDVFTPRQTGGEKIIILYPRRLTWIRGVDDVKAAAVKLTGRYDRVEIHFVGRAGNDAEEEKMRAWAAGHERCKYYWVPMEEMVSVYQQADIVLIPTRAAEGTSLSCLEAMACGKAVINGLVGGLSDLIINDYNGLLVNVSPQTLEAAIVDLIEHPKKRRRLGQKALETAAAFSLGQWKKRWAKALAGTWGEIH